MAGLSEVIEIDSSSDDEGYQLIDLDNEHDAHAKADDPHQNASSDPSNHYDACFRSVLELFPDISHDHIRNLYDEKIQSTHGVEPDSLIPLLLDSILNGGSYPKEKDRLRALKDLQRKGDADRAEDDEAARWKLRNPQMESPFYAKACKLALQEAFPYVPSKYLDEQFSLHRNFYGAYIVIAKAQRQLEDGTEKPYAKLKCHRYNASRSTSTFLNGVNRHQFDVTSMKLEMEAARKRKLHDDDEWRAQAEKAAEIARREQRERDRGETMECACCFDDVPMSKITHCNGEIPHFFCYECARRNADNDVGSNKYDLQCMHECGCEATFGREERAKFLDLKMIEKIDNLEQQACIQGAMHGLADFVTCPFCHYGQICPPAEEDREFRCNHPDCREVSCRLCKEKSHIPMSCEEYKRDKGISERRVVEEARTEALIRTCLKCKIRILKEDGCNKIICTTCRSVICDYCGKDITKEGYQHFDDQRFHHQAQQAQPAQPASSKCPLYDKPDRKDIQIEEAGKAATEKVRKGNPELSEEDLKIKFSEEVKRKKHSSRHPAFHEAIPFPEMYQFLPPHHGEHPHRAVFQAPNVGHDGQPLNFEAFRAAHAGEFHQAINPFRRMGDVPAPANGNEGQQPRHAPLFGMAERGHRRRGHGFFDDILNRHVGRGGIAPNAPGDGIEGQAPHPPPPFGRGEEGRGRLEHAIFDDILNRHAGRVDAAADGRNRHEGRLADVRDRYAERLADVRNRRPSHRPRVVLPPPLNARNAQPDNPPQGNLPAPQHLFVEETRN